MGYRKKGWARIGAIVLLTLALIYLGKLAGLVLARQRAAAVETRLQVQLSALDAEVHAIETAATEAGSDAYAERWAREERQWVRDGDQPVAALPATPSSADDQGAEARSDGGLWAKIKRWFRGEP